MISVKTLVKSLCRKAPELLCECCRGSEHLGAVPPIMGGDRLGTTPTRRAICSPCFSVWYDSGITDSEELGKESLRLKALGKFPWTGPYAQAA